ncbi:alpha/beta fold hydrolase [Frankia sp. ACN1ag]|uniref:alpha/beta fold hydrolase n=1 Tax=Frankia sp. ACN1ag TaxID=102891 RepID=UPI0009F8FECC|nr:alpha/beta hydrolase [Frankia sp. ACN1ag]
MAVHQCGVDGLPVSYTDIGSGPVLLFVHGVYVTGALWKDLVALLGDRYRCIVPTWPLGAHEPVGDADLSAAATARRILHLIELLDLDDVTVVANDTGGGLVLTALGDDSLDLARIGGLVLTNCDSYEHFPPGSFRHIARLCRASRRLGAVVLSALASGPGRAFFMKAVCVTAVPRPRQDEIFGPFATNASTRHEAVRVTASLDPALTMRAAPAIERFSRPVVLAWGTDDKLFPLDHARRLAQAFPNARLVEISDSSTFVMLDAPDRLARIVAEAVDARLEAGTDPGLPAEAALRTDQPRSARVHD